MILIQSKNPKCPKCFSKLNFITNKYSTNVCYNIIKKMLIESNNRTITNISIYKTSKYYIKRKLFTNKNVSGTIFTNHNQMKNAYINEMILFISLKCSKCGYDYRVSNSELIDLIKYSNIK